MNKNKNSSKKNLHKNITIKNTMKIDVKLATTKLCRRVDTTFYFNKDCWTSFTGHELKSVPKLLFYLYKNRAVNPKNKKITGIHTTRICNDLGKSKANFASLVWKLIPIFVNVNSDKSKKNW